ncbi:phosphopantetheine-binding protein [Clostridium cellulovorans]|uniref:Phosphopantetheine-binding n=1 Tax=Clostridium cellulovorans (strain ATCC 35296 / DSM 3052 / OCM 3 / 743B) TaxID=573061 RepID=D9SRB0_CLOC7|nr:phosphopantetheine-binding protein [Clostridium cellulovorans]ADL52339.1 phosphopantetheine-binding [Clostridium cellulovorans 743B]
MVNNSEVKKLTETEGILLELWKEALKKENVDLEKSFFVQGGTSLAVTALCREIQKKFAGVVEIADIFTYFSIRSLAKFIDDKQGKLDKESMREKVSQESTEHVEDIIFALEKDDFSVDDALSKLLDE